MMNARSRHRKKCAAMPHVMAMCLNYYVAPMLPPPLLIRSWGDAANVTVQFTVPTASKHHRMTALQTQGAGTPSLAAPASSAKLQE
jgi:hypothetical protein